MYSLLDCWRSCSCLFNANTRCCLPRIHTIYNILLLLDQKMHNLFSRHEQNGLAWSRGHSCTTRPPTVTNFKENLVPVYLVSWPSIRADRCNVSDSLRRFCAEGRVWLITAVKKGHGYSIFNAKMTASISFSLYLELMVIHTLTSSWKKPFGICSICSSESKSVGSSGRNCWRVRLAVLSRLSKRGRLGERASVSSLRSTFFDYLPRTSEDV